MRGGGRNQPALDGCRCGGDQSNHEGEPKIRMRNPRTRISSKISLLEQIVAKVPDRAFKTSPKVTSTKFHN